MSLSDIFADTFRSTTQKYANINSIYVSGEIVSLSQDILPLIAGAKGKRIPIFSSAGNIGTNHTAGNIAFALQEAILDELTPVKPSAEFDKKKIGRAHV